MECATHKRESLIRVLLREHIWSCVTSTKRSNLQYWLTSLLSSITWIGRENPLNLSISVRGGKEINWESLSNGEWTGKSSSGRGIFIPRCPVWIGARFLWLSWCLLEYSIKEGENPVKDRLKDQNGPILWVELFESATRSWRYVSPKANYKARPIANKYREGKLKSTLKREWKVRETVEGELEWVLTNLMPWFILGNLVTML